MKLNKKAAIELSVNFLVMLIITLVIFGSSMVMVKKFFGGATDIKRVYDERTEQEIERLLDDGSRVAIPFDKKKIANGEFATFGMGVLNVLGKDQQNDFRIQIKFNKAFHKDNTPICDSSSIASQATCQSPNMWLSSSNTPDSNQNTIGLVMQKTIKNNEQQKFLMGVEVDPGTEPGTYIFDMNVCFKETIGTSALPKDSTRCPDVAGFPIPYERVKKLYVEVI
jgi:hypothetical protein